MDIKRKTVIITGGSKGLGKAMAKLFAERGATVVIGSNVKNELEATANELGVDHYTLDVTKASEVGELAHYAVAKYGQIDYWINNAGIQIAPSPIEEIDDNRIHDLFEINFFGYFYGFKEALKIMKKRGFGTIVSINSKAGLDGYPDLGAYSASKFALTGLTKAMRKELARDGSGVKVFSIHPGGIKTELYKEKYPDEFEAYMSPEYAAQIIVDNILSNNPEFDLVINRPS